ncbi:ParB/RepB/Spo0J family partition protein [Prauserella cavernicola]|nr:ParB/RepB/Spo0J family partition protein [Prauserella cavernicola]
MLAESAAPLPPILLHRPTMKVIDGMHRLRAVGLRGHDEILVRYFEGSEAEAFVWAVHTNIAHGLPLTRADREAAAGRILRTHPDWSDRAIAATSGLSPATVGVLRHRSTGQISQLNTRVGRDGRVRPLNAAEGRRRAGEIIAKHPEISLREVARLAGVSVGTARDVRERLRRGDDPVPERVRELAQRQHGARGKSARAPVHMAEAEQSIALHNLCRDPSIRFSETGRSLIRWLGVHSVRSDGLEDVVRAIPPHLTGLMAELARACAEKWISLAEELDERSENSA